MRKLFGKIHTTVDFCGGWCPGCAILEWCETAREPYSAEERDWMKEHNDFPREILFLPRGRRSPLMNVIDDISRLYTADFCHTGVTLNHNIGQYWAVLGRSRQYSRNLLIRLIFRPCWFGLILLIFAR